MKKTSKHHASALALLVAAGVCAPVRADGPDDADMNGMCTKCAINMQMPIITPVDPGGAAGRLGYVSKWGFDDDDQAASGSRLQVRPNAGSGGTAAPARERWWCVNPYFTVDASRAGPTDPTAGMARPAPPRPGPAPMPVVPATLPDWTFPFTLFLNYAGSGPEVGKVRVPPPPVPPNRVSSVPAGTTLPLRLKEAQCGHTVGGVLPALVFHTEWQSGVSGFVTVEWAENPWVGRPRAMPMPAPPASASPR